MLIAGLKREDCWVVSQWSASAGDHPWTIGAHICRVWERWLCVNR